MPGVGKNVQAFAEGLREEVEINLRIIYCNSLLLSGYRPT
jgi:hypothetical protein